MSLIRNSAFLILEVINLDTQLSLANGKRLRVYPEINKSKGGEDWGSLRLKSITVIDSEKSGILLPHNVSPLLALYACPVGLPANLNRKYCTSMNHSQITGLKKCHSVGCLLLSLPFVAQESCKKSSEKSWPKIHNYNRGRKPKEQQMEKDEQIHCG